MEIAAKGSPIEKVQGIMYLLLLIVFPLLFLVSPIWRRSHWSPG
jgi:hypothetical protein